MLPGNVKNLRAGFQFGVQEQSLNRGGKEKTEGRKEGNNRVTRRGRAELKQKREGSGAERWQRQPAGGRSKSYSRLRGKDPKGKSLGEKEGGIRAEKLKKVRSGDSSRSGEEWRCRRPRSRKQGGVHEAKNSSEKSAPSRGGEAAKGKLKSSKLKKGDTNPRTF